MRVLTLLLCLAFIGCAPDSADPATPPPETSVTDSVRLPATVGDTFAVSTPDTTWTAGITEIERPPGEATLRAVRSAAHEGFDRTVFEFDGSDVPSVHVEYIDAPVRQCGSGQPVPLAGDGWLDIRFSYTRAHTDAGTPTIAERSRAPELPVLRELSLTCDFEGTVTWVLGLAAPNRYRVTELSDPARLAVDVRQGDYANR